MTDRHDEIVEIAGVTKRFPGVIALNHVSVGFRRGEVHAVVGENGAGKSTLINILAGEFPPNEGEVRLDGKPARFASPLDSRAAGIVVVYPGARPLPDHERRRKRHDVGPGDEPGRLAHSAAEDAGRELGPRWRGSECRSSIPMRRSRAFRSRRCNSSRSPRQSASARGFLCSTSRTPLFPGGRASACSTSSGSFEARASQSCTFRIAWQKSSTSRTAFR